MPFVSSIEYCCFFNNLVHSEMLQNNMYFPIKSVIFHLVRQVLQWLFNYNGR